MKYLFIRGYYGVNVNADMAGDLGIVDYSNQVTPDLSALYSASYLKKNNYEVSILDCNAEKMLPETALKSIKEGGFNMIFLKTCAPTVKLDLELCRVIKSESPDSKIHLFGHQAKILKDWIYNNCDYVDVVIEESIENYVHKKVLMMDHDLHIDELPYPDYTLLNYEKYSSSDSKKNAYLWGSRGCSLTCTYCPYITYYGRRIEDRSIELLLDDIEKLLTLGYEYIQFRDPFFTSNKKRITALCEGIIEKELEFEWYCETRVDTLDKHLIELMAKAGNKLIGLGIETASDQVLIEYKRPLVNMEVAKRNIKLMAENGIDSLGFFLIGFPGESYESMEETYQLSIDLGLTYGQFNVWTLYPDTDIWSQFASEVEINPDLFLEFENRVAYNPVKDLNRDSLNEIADLFTFSHYKNNFGLEFAFRTRKFNELKRMRSVKQKEHAIKLMDKMLLGDLR